MFQTTLRIAAVLAAAGFACPALAGSSPWFDTEGGRVRLLAADAPEADGTLRGALQIELKPGWKTYWQDPGDAGVPPQIDVSPSLNIVGAEIGFPGPSRVGGEDGWAGYDKPVALPVTFRIGDPAAFSAVDADVFLGICQDICIPVQGRLTVAPQPSGDSDAQVIAAAHAALPAAAAAGLQATRATRDGGELVIDAEAPAGAGTPELFVVTPDGFVFGPPRAEPVPGGVRFRIKIADEPSAGAAVPELDYTLVAGERAVQGKVAPR